MLSAPTYSHSSQVSDVFADEGLTKSPDFIFLTPFWDGRAVALASDAAPQEICATGWRIAAFIAQTGLGKFLFKRSRSGASRKHSRGDIFTNSPIAGVKSPRGMQHPLQQQAPQQTPKANNITADSPMGWLMQKQTRAAEVVQDPFANVGTDGVPVPALIKGVSGRQCFFWPLVC